MVVVLVFSLGSLVSILLGFNEVRVLKLLSKFVNIRSYIGLVL